MVTTQFTEQRAAVIEYIRSGMIMQGATELQALEATTGVYFFDSREVVNLYRCITSDLQPDVIAAIVAHDYNGLANHAVAFLPKSRQFEREA